jgi:hypothetical protein
VIAFIQDEKTREIYQVASSNSTLITAVPELSKSSNDFAGIKAYPNPASEELYISFEKELVNEAVMQIIDGYGRIVKDIQVFPHISLVETNVNDLPNGMYFIRLIQHNGNTRTLKILIAH